MSPKTSRRSFALRYYLWADDQAYRIPHRLHSKLLEGKVRLLRCAGTAQGIIEATIVNRGAAHPPQIELQYTTYVFDKDGWFDLGDQANAIQGTLGSKVSGNVVDVQNVLAGRRWTASHQWTAPQAAVEQVVRDILSEKRSKNYKPLPILRVES
jgi:hypothetical protein